jgi:antitoxin (DNA-binding transcriptional repressor) of toxin-antitoxin stability system
MIQATVRRTELPLDMHDICTTLGCMKTKWLASRELSARPGRALAAVGRAGRVLITAHGKPKAIMIPTTEATFAHDLEMLDRVALTQAVEAIRADSVVNGTDTLTMDEIDAEVAAVRAGRRRQ